MTTVPMRVWGSGNMSVVTMVPAGITDGATPVTSCEISVTALTGSVDGSTTFCSRRPLPTATGPDVPVGTAPAA